MISIAAIIFGCLAFIIILLGGYVSLKLKNYLNYLIAFCGGALISSSLFNLLPEALEILPDVNYSLIFGITLISFLLFHFLDKIVFIHTHEHEGAEEEMHEESHHIGLFAVSGIIIHTFLDGIAIGAAFLVDPVVGLLVASVALLHQFADGISTTTMLLRYKQKDFSTKIFILVAAFAPMMGILTAQILRPNQEFLGYLLAAFAGFFLYIGASDLLPEAHRVRSSKKLVVFTVLGAGIIVVLRLILAM